MNELDEHSKPGGPRRSGARAAGPEAICPYCGVGCRLGMEIEEDRIQRVWGVADAPANRGGICAKGATLPQVIQGRGRLAVPFWRDDREGPFRETTWESAIEGLAARFRRTIAEHGPDSVAFYGSGQLDTQATYLACKLFKGSIGTNNTDSNSRLCMAAAAAGYKMSLGADGPPTSYDDIDESDCVIIWGGNMAEAHPVVFDRIKARIKASKDFCLIVVDPRRTTTAAHAALHVAVAPGGDVALMNALGWLLLERGAIDHEFIAAHTNGFDDYRRFLLEADWDELVRASGVPAPVIHALADRIERASAWLTFYCMGLNQSTIGMWKNNSLINLHLLAGQIGKPGAGPFSMTGQPNAMGGRESGLLAHQLPGYRFIEEPAHRAEVEAYWGRPPGTISQRPGLTAVEMFRALEGGRLKAIWIAATNPAVSLPDLHHVRRALDQAELVVVQDAYFPTETARMADVVLPAAQWAEKTGTSTDSERRVSWSERAVAPPGVALPDWEILARFARALGHEGFDHSSADEVWDEFIGLTAGRPCDMTGITAARLRRERHLAWPCPGPDHPGTARLYLDRRFPTADGRACFLPRPSQPPRETPDHEFPLVLNTGRVYSHWHSRTRTGRSPKLVAREPGPFLEVHPDDANELGLDAGQLVEVASRRGVVRLPLRLAPSLKRGMVFAPFHWGDEHSARCAINYLTISATGRIARQPELKYCAVRLAPAHPRAGPPAVVQGPAALERAETGPGAAKVPLSHPRPAGPP